MKSIHILILFAASILFTNCADDNQTIGCGEAIRLQSYEQDAYTLILNYEVSSAVTIEASITSGNADPDDGIVFSVNGNILNFEQAGLTPGNYGLYLRTVCNDGIKGDWIHLTPITINQVCNKPLTINSIERDDAELKYDIDTDLSDNTYTIEAKWINETGETKITQISRYQSKYTLIDNIPPGFYQLYIRTVCQDDTKGAWNGPFEIPIDNYQCMKPYNINSATSSSGATYIWWFEGHYDYSQWEYVHVVEGQPISSGSIQIANDPNINGTTTTNGYDLYIRGVCSANTYTDWVQVF